MIRLNQTRDTDALLALSTAPRTAAVAARAICSRRVSMSTFWRAATLPHVRQSADQGVGGDRNTASAGVSTVGAEAWKEGFPGTQPGVHGARHVRAGTVPVTGPGSAEDNTHLRAPMPLRTGAAGAWAPSALPVKRPPEGKLRWELHIRRSMSTASTISMSTATPPQSSGPQSSADSVCMFGSRTNVVGQVCGKAQYRHDALPRRGAPISRCCTANGTQCGHGSSDRSGGSMRRPPAAHWPPGLMTCTNRHVTIRIEILKPINCQEIINYTTL